MKLLSETEAASSNQRPLCVDLDGTLLCTDSAYERLLAFLKQHFWQTWRLPLWLLKGRAHLKDQLARHTALTVAALPVREDFVEFLRAEHARGRRLVLATGADADTARRITERYPFFDEFVATDGRMNLTGERKRAWLVERFGEKGFDYAGNASVDRPIWRAAKECIVVNAGAGLQRQVAGESNVVRVFQGRGGWFGTLLRVLRVHQWTKNVLLLVPAITGHKVGEWEVLWREALAIFAFSLCASSVYVANDLHDLESDRDHRTKRTRPFAAGRFPIRIGLALAPLLLALAFLGAAWLPPMFGFYLAIYYLTATLYSFALKRIVLLDVFVLAGLYTLRILAGHGATGIAYSNWLLGFSLFTFLSLALLKRYIELHRGDETRPAARGYQGGDLQVVLMMGIGSGYLAALVLALYINSKEVLEVYRQPMLLLFICPLLLYWVSRVWLLATRDRIDDDPVVFALKDRTSYLVGALVALFIWMASVM